MVVLLSLLFLNFVHGSYGLSYTAPHPKTQGKPWPMPQQYYVTNDVMILSPSFEFTVAGTDCDLLRSALNRYAKIILFTRAEERSIRKSRSETHPTLREAMVDLSGACDDLPVLGMDEAYDLKVANDTASLSSKSIWGILRGLETFSQLFYRGPYGTKIINVTDISDFPRFSHRGVMLDTSRHFLSKKVLLKNLDAMAYNKMNVFHWHIVDDQSFPYQSVAFPNITRYGAYNPVNHVYTQEDIAEIIEYARLRGIRVVAEFDTPGHSQAWGRGQPGLLTPCYDSKGQLNDEFGPIDPSKDTTYTFLAKFMQEVTTVFKDKYLHLGGDEVSFGCWESNPNITDFMKRMSFGKDYAKLESYYIEKLVKIVASLNAGYVIWQDVFDNNVAIKSDTVVHVWRPGHQTELARVTKAGYHALLSSPWYLNYISYGHDWENYYKVEPLDFNGTDAQKDLVLGGEACMWGEYVDGTNAISRLWPRASAVAERLWSSRDLKDVKVSDRLEEHRCRLLSREIPVEPVNGPGVCLYEYDGLY